MNIKSATFAFVDPDCKMSEVFLKQKMYCKVFYPGIVKKIHCVGKWF